MVVKLQLQLLTSSVMHRLAVSLAADSCQGLCSGFAIVHSGIAFASFPSHHPGIDPPLMRQSSWLLCVMDRLLCADVAWLTPRTWHPELQPKCRNAANSYEMLNGLRYQWLRSGKKVGTMGRWRVSSQSPPLRSPASAKANLQANPTKCEKKMP